MKKATGKSSLSHSDVFAAALGDLRAAEYLRSRSPNFARQALKLIDDASELILKATLLAEGVECEARPFPWLVKECQTIADLPDGLGAMHKLRNRVKHGGAEAPHQEVADAFRAVVVFANRLGRSKLATHLDYLYCVKCHSATPVERLQEVTMKGKRATRKVLTGWCFICDARTFKIIQ